MSRQFLALVNDVAADLGVTGGSIPAVSGSISAEQQRIVNWVARADLIIQTEWTDWKFLWVRDTAVSATANNDFILPANPFNDIDRGSLVINVGTYTPQYPVWMDWEEFQRVWQDKPKKTQLYPSNWSMDPTGKIWLSHILQSTLPTALNYWKTPARMVNSTDTSPIPSTFDTVIVERAKMIYGQRENAPEVLTGASAEFMNLIDKLESVQLPRQIARRKAGNDSYTNPDGYVE